MWGSRDDGRGPEVTCIACGRALDRAEAREYDKYGDRWDRRGKDFEYLCKPCDRARCHQPRDDLEATLADAERAAESDRGAFLREYLARTQDREDSVEEP